MTFLPRLRALLAVLFHRSVEVRSPQGWRFHLFLADRLVLPVIQGGAPEEGEDEGGGDGEPDGDGDDKGNGDGEEGEEEKEGEGEGEGEGDEGDGDGEDEGGGTIDWKKMARKHESGRKAAERKLKREQRERKKLEEDAKKRADAEKTEHEKAVEKAREEGEQAALTKAQKERRKDRLEAAVARLASRGVKVGEGDDAKTVRFADPEDAQVFLDRKLSLGDVDEEDIFDDDGKVQTEALGQALAEILEDRPRLAEDARPSKPSGSADGGKGKGADKGLEDMSVEEHFQRIRRDK